MPELTNPLVHSVGTNPLVEKSYGHTLRPLDDNNSILYYQNFGGGGVALGLLGPFGVAANMAMIEKNTDSDVALLKGKLELNPQAIFSEIASEYPSLSLSNAPQTTAVRITPLLNVVKQEDEQLLFGCSILVDFTATGTSWVGKYVYQLPLKYTKAEVAHGLSVAQRTALVDQAGIGFRAIAKLYLDDRDKKLIAKRELRYKSTFVEPRFDFEYLGQELPSQGQRINVRTLNTVYSFPSGYAQILN
jgi:hypothetical protein